jgi:hypothetical protein
MAKSSHHVEYNSLMARQNQPIAGNGRGASDSLVSMGFIHLREIVSVGEMSRSATVLRCRFDYVTVPRLVPIDPGVPALFVPHKPGHACNNLGCRRII